MKYLLKCIHIILELSIFHNIKMTFFKRLPVTNAVVFVCELVYLYIIIRNLINNKIKFHTRRSVYANHFTRTIFYNSEWSLQLFMNTYIIDVNAELAV